MVTALDTTTNIGSPTSVIIPDRIRERITAAPPLLAGETGREDGQNSIPQVLLLRELPALFRDEVPAQVDGVPLQSPLPLHSSDSPLSLTHSTCTRGAAITLPASDPNDREASTREKGSKKPKPPPVEPRWENPRIPYMHSPEFLDTKRREEFLTEPACVIAYRELPPGKVPSNVPPEYKALFESNLLGKPEEQFFFRKMNYLKYLANEVLEGGDGPANLRRVDSYLREAREIRDLIISANIRLVVNVLKRNINEHRSLGDIISDGQMSLIAAVEKFNYFFGNKFSTYATWALTKNAARQYPAEEAHRGRYRTNSDGPFDLAPDHRGGSSLDEEDAAEHKGRILKRWLDSLEDRERVIIEARKMRDDPPSLGELARQLGITDERVRQIQVKAMKKLREAAAKEMGSEYDRLLNG